MKTGALFGLPILWTLLFCPILGAAPAIPQKLSLSGGDLGSDTWVGVDALERVLPTSKEAGPPRPHKTLGMFYFLTFDRSGDGPYDNTKTLAAHPEALQNVHDPAWGPPNANHYWGKPLFGYYVSDDEYVLRKHAQMLVNAGVDVVIFDNSNAVTYDPARNALCRVWEQIRREGGKTPQIAFLCPFSNSNGIGSSTLAHLYDTLYAPGRDSDLWFRWQGKPLIMADPSYASADGLRRLSSRQAARLVRGSTLGQTFTAAWPFDAVGGEFPTWATTGSGMTLSLRVVGPRGPVLVRQTFGAVADNATVLLHPTQPLPPGRYYLEMSAPVGQIGWWSYSDDVYSGGAAYEDGQGADGDRVLGVHFVGEAQAQTLVQDRPPLSSEAAESRARTIRDFFTFRTPIGPYNLAAPPLDNWGWLQIFPQAPQRDAAGDVEQITVGVAQNYNARVNRTAPMSFPGAFSRSYHAGHLDTRPGAVNQGLNFAEQWARARQVDPPFVFVTGWNEWTAGLFQDWAGFHAPPAIFVDEFNEEGSRDIEPMSGGHGDDYYYQLVSEARRYKGVRPLPPVTPAAGNLFNSFAAWKSVQPEFRDTIGDTAHRAAPGVGKAGPYVNTTGRNDIVAAKVSYDKANVYFYVRTRAALTPHTDKDWMLLYLNTDRNYKTGWLGYDYVVNRRAGTGTTSLEKNLAGRYRWTPLGKVRYKTQGTALMIAIPRAALGVKTLPAVIDFKWADHCYARGDATDFTLNGDAAPDDRFNYRAKLGRE